MGSGKRRLYGHVSKPRPDRNERNSGTAPKAPATDQKRRHLGEIMDLGPQNDEERERLAEFHRKETAYFEKRFAGMVRRDIKRRLYYSTFANLRIIRGDYLYAITRQGKPEADLLLDRIAADIMRQERTPERPPSKPPAPPTQGTAVTIGVGGFPNDCCQQCGRFLQTICYSKQITAARVPKTNKICRHCYDKLPGSDQAGFYTYRYQPGYEAKGTGFNPDKA